MSDGWKTLRVPADKYEEAKEQKESDGRTWGEQIVRPGDDGDDLGELKELVERVPDRAAQKTVRQLEENHR